MGEEEKGTKKEESRIRRKKDGDGEP